MTADSMSRWLTFGANFGVLIGIILLLVELDQNATVMKAQISNDRSSQAIDLFMSIAESPELSGIGALLQQSGFPEDTSKIAELTPVQKHQYDWYLRAMRFRVENLLYQQTLGVVYDPEHLVEARRLLPELLVFGVAGSTEKLERLIADVEKIHE